MASDYQRADAPTEAPIRRRWTRSPRRLSAALDRGRGRAEPAAHEWSKRRRAKASDASESRRGLASRLSMPPHPFRFASPLLLLLTSCTFVSSPRPAARFVAHAPAAPSSAAPSSAAPTAMADPNELAGLIPRAVRSRRIVVRPVLFVPSDMPVPDVGVHDALMRQHLELARDHYLQLLGTTFAVDRGPLAVYRSPNPESHFMAPPDATTDRAHRVLAELFAWRSTDRYASNDLFVTLFVSSSQRLPGGGRPFNGAAGTGGGYVELDVASLTTDRPYPFQSSLVHEIGHAVGLSHSECHGYDQSLGHSIMSYDPRHHSRGLARSATPGGFSREDLAMLALSPRVFPNLDPRRVPAVDTARLSSCFMGPMSEAVGAYRSHPGVGFELLLDGRHVHGAAASLYSRAVAERTCQWNEARQRAQVTCRYNGEPMR